MINKIKNLHKELTEIVNKNDSLIKKYQDAIEDKENKIIEINLELEKIIENADLIDDVFVKKQEIQKLKKVIGIFETKIKRLQVKSLINEDEYKFKIKETKDLMKQLYNTKNKEIEELSKQIRAIEEEKSHALHLTNSSLEIIQFKLFKSPGRYQLDNGVWIDPQPNGNKNVVKTLSYF